MRPQLHFGKPSAFHEIYNNTKRWDKDDELYNVTGFKSGSFVYRKYAQAKGVALFDPFSQILAKTSV